MHISPCVVSVMAAAAADFPGLPKPSTAADLYTKPSDGVCAVVGALPSLTPKFPADSLFYLLVIETLPPRCVQAVIEFAGGWNISGAPDSGIDFQEKIFR